MNQKMSFLMVLMVMSFLVLSGQVQAGKCKMHVKREACSGKESESYKKCAGEQECDIEKEADSAVICEKELVKEMCKNARVDITKMKTISAIFDGKPVGGGGNLCTNTNEFNKCQ